MCHSASNELKFNTPGYYRIILYLAGSTAAKPHFEVIRRFHDNMPYVILKWVPQYLEVSHRPIFSRNTLSPEPYRVKIMVRHPQSAAWRFLSVFALLSARVPEEPWGSSLQIRQWLGCRLAEKKKNDKIVNSHREMTVFHHKHSK